MPKLPRTIRLDPSDLHVFERAAAEGEWAISGAFVFLAEDPALLTGKRRQAFASGFLGLGDLGWSTFVTVSSATEAEVEATVQALATHLERTFGAPSRAEALDAARTEVDFARELCAEHPVNTLLAVRRELSDDGGIREGFRVVEPPRGKSHARIWDLVADDTGPDDDGETRH